MRGILEKPRTTIGWKGLITTASRRVLRHRTGLKKASGCCAKSPKWAAGGDRIPGRSCRNTSLTSVSWAAVGARTTESQTHRECSGLSMPVGFKMRPMAACKSHTHARRVMLAQLSGRCQRQCAASPEDHGTMAFGSLPSVAFLKPTGMDSPLAISRWVCDSVVRAPQPPNSRSQRCIAARSDPGIRSPPAAPIR